MADSDLLIHTGLGRDNPATQALKDAVDEVDGVMGSTLLGAADVCTIYVRFESTQTDSEELMRVAHEVIPSARLVGI